ncbi:MAG: RluA family pseudouridine synthase [Deltaproteobacteria bacterium]|nr:RluA family pseudouridine synthase [Deltaproteobacteria bacterium]
MKIGKEEIFEFHVTAPEAGTRLDVFLATNIPSMTRSQIQKLIDQGLVQVRGQKTKAGQKLKAGEAVILFKPPPVEDELAPEDLPLRILYEDQAIAVVEKPAGMVVHPAAGNVRGTLVNALLHHLKDLSGVGGVLRPGIVHRLDKGTSGVMVVAKNDAAHKGLTDQFKKREVKKVYLALVYGDVRENEGVVDLPVGRHPRDRKRMSIRSPRGREAFTRWRVVERFGDVTLLEVVIKTGRTHQIRVHLNTIGHPVIGDRTYGNPRRLASIADRAERSKLAEMKRQTLHAGTLGFCHPLTREQMEFTSPLPEDMETLIQYLRERTPV